jgi:hypothetical protein
LELIHQNREVNPDSAPAPVMNPFFAALASSQGQAKVETPAQLFRSHLLELQKIAMTGDVTAWNQQLPRVNSFAQTANIALEEDLGTRVELKKMEMTLLLQAGNKARTQGEELKRKAREIRAEDPAQAKELILKAERHLALADKLHGPLLSKTGIGLDA